MIHYSLMYNVHRKFENTNYTGKPAGHLYSLMYQTDTVQIERGVADSCKLKTLTICRAGPLRLPV